MTCVAGLSASGVGAESRFPRPDFVSGYVSPEITVPPIETNWLSWLDVGGLVLALTLAALLVLRWRKRSGMVALTVASVAYFGFFRHGCVCPVGAIQNVTLSLTDPAFIFPAAVAFIFLLPLVFSLLFGRVFCAGVCPLGAIQELVVIRPVKLPSWLNKMGSVSRHLFLGLVVFAAVTGTGFFICRLDPFVTLFRFGGQVPALIIAVGILALATVVGRPYCRFLCPYSVLLEWCGRLAWKRTTITPGECVTCRLCEDSCPYDAIEKPELDTPRAKRRVAREHRALLVMLFLLPFITVGGWTAGSIAGAWVGHRNPQVRTAELLSQAGKLTGIDRERLEAFEMSGRDKDEAIRAARHVYQRYQKGGRWLGAFAGLVIAFHLIRFSRHHPHDDYRPDPASCLSCGRCFRYCPVIPPAGNSSTETARR